MGLLKIKKIAIANRGEVAARIIRACHELGIKTVLLHSEADQASIAFRLADERVCIGPSPTSESYLNIDANIQGAVSAGADAIHPGFGFLSENADFAEACQKNKIEFIGPSAESIRLFGDKISAKELVIKAGGPVIPGYQGEDQSSSTLLKKLDEIGYPAIVKATAGGGGRGIKVVRKAEDGDEAIESAKREGLNAFGSDSVFLEKYMDKAKHIEVQIFADASGKVFHLNERECSVQRKHQKIIEESLSPVITDAQRQHMTEVAIKIAQEAKYKGAGTIEFLLQGNQFYFLEMNTRLQVEHPVTELVMGVDLVKAQILTAMGRALTWEDDIQPRGHAIECRVYAEDPYQNGMPSTGQLSYCHFPQGPHRRFEIGFESGDAITPFYDSMIAKIIVWDETRARCIEKMKVTLKDTIIFGVKTNIPYLIDILSHKEFTDGSMTTKFIENNYPEGLKAIDPNQAMKGLFEELGKKVSESKIGGKGNVEESYPSPWSYSWN